MRRRFAIGVGAALTDASDAKYYSLTKAGQRQLEASKL